MGANTVAFGGVTVGSNKAKEHVQVAGINRLIGSVSGDRATAEFGAISVDPQVLKRDEETSSKLDRGGLGASSTTSQEELRTMSNLKLDAWLKRY